MIPSTEHRILDIVATHLGCERAELSRVTNFERDLEIDSLGALEVQMAVEESFDIELPDDVIECVHSIDDLIQIIEGLWPACQSDNTD